MKETNKKQRLTEEQKELVYKAIQAGMIEEDRPPEEVINTDFNGDEDAYLRRMAQHLNVPL